MPEPPLALPTDCTLWGTLSKSKGSASLSSSDALPGEECTFFFFNF